jgi:release factor glutamine methyltransferase
VLSRDAVALRLRAAGCVFAEDEADLLLASARDDDLEALVAQRAAGRPLEHVLGWAELSGVRLQVDAGVFVPRRRSELLVREAVRLASARSTAPVVLDLCCGCGALGVVVATFVEGVELHAVEIDAVSAVCARRNLARLGGVVHEGDLYAALPSSLLGRVDVVVANAPYVPSDEIAFLPPEARDFEPRVALDGGPEGVDVQRRVVEGAVEWLSPGGHVLVETSQRQVPLTLAAFEAAGLAAHVVTDDDLAACIVVGSAVQVLRP